MCLAIIELLFLIGGLWSLVTGKLPVGLFKILFGKGNYALPPMQARLFGLLLASVLPLAFGASTLLRSLPIENNVAYAALFEIVYILVVSVIAIVIARRIRQPEQDSNPYSQPQSQPVKKKALGYGPRLLVMTGFVVLVSVTFVSICSLIGVVASSVMIGTRWTGDFWSDIFPFIAMVGIIIMGAFGSFTLFQLLRQSS